MRQPQTTPLVTYAPLTEIEAVAGEPVRGKCKDGAEVLFGQIRPLDIAEFEREIGSTVLLFDPAHRIGAGLHMCLISLRHHNPDVTMEDVDALFASSMIWRISDVVAAVLPPFPVAGEAEEPAPETGCESQQPSASDAGGPSTTS